MNVETITVSRECYYCGYRRKVTTMDLTDFLHNYSLEVWFPIKDKPCSVCGHIVFTTYMHLGAKRNIADICALRLGLNYEKP